MGKKKTIKPRTLRIDINSTQLPIIEFDEQQQILKITGIKKFGIREKDIIIGRVYYEKGNSKNKILNQQSFSYSTFNVDFNKALIDEYNIIVACDTNYIEQDSKKICVSCLSILSGLPNQHYYHPIVALVFTLEKNNLINPERMGWSYFIKIIDNWKELPPDSKIGFVVDSDLGELELINEGHSIICKC